MNRQLAAQVADRFDLGPDARPEVEAVRGEQGQVRRLITARGTYAVQESFGSADSVDPDEAQLSAQFQVACHDAGVACPRPLPDRDGRFLAVIERVPIRVQTWVEVTDADNSIDPVAVGNVLATLHRVVVPAAAPPHGWGTEPVGRTEWRALVKAAKGAGAPFAARLDALTPALLAMEELLTPMVGVQWCHLDLWADNLRLGPDGQACVVDFDNAGAGDPTRELAMVLFEFARTSRDRAERLVSAYVDAGGPGRVTRAQDFGLTIAQLHHILRYQVLGWLAARDPEARARAHAGVAEFVDDPFLPEDVERILGWLSP